MSEENFRGNLLVKGMISFNGKKVSPDEEHVVPLRGPKGNLTIGRANEANLQTDGATASRRHAAIVWTPDTIVIEDRGSANGTFVGQDRVTSQQVKNGDVIYAGPLIITVSGIPAA